MNAMDRPPTPPQGEYCADAASWDHDVTASLRASRRRAWWVAGAALLVALAEALALAALAPLKTVVPYTITVDRQTGAAAVARPVDLGALPASESLTRSALAQYVMARETLDATDLAENYRKTGLWSAGAARSDYLRAMDRANPASVLNGANAATRIAVTIRQISLMTPATALVRFRTVRREGTGPEVAADWAAVLRFGFSGAPLSPEDRLLDPLGFQVSAYRSDAELPVP